MATNLNFRPIADVLGSHTESSIHGSVGEPMGSVGLLAVDLVETANCLELRIGLPAGVSESDIAFSLEGNKLMFFATAPKKGEQGFETSHYSGQHPTQGGQEGRSMMSGLEYGSGQYTQWFREIDLPMAVDESQLGASFEHGMLKVCIPLDLGIRPEDINISQSKSGYEGLKGQSYTGQVGKSISDVNTVDCVTAGTC